MGLITHHEFKPATEALTGVNETGNSSICETQHFNNRHRFFLGPTKKTRF
jgi:hypothetical protein